MVWGVPGQAGDLASEEHEGRPREHVVQEVHLPLSGTQPTGTGVAFVWEDRPAGANSRVRASQGWKGSPHPASSSWAFRVCRQDGFLVHQCTRSRYQCQVWERAALQPHVCRELQGASSAGGSGGSGFMASRHLTWLRCQFSVIVGRSVLALNRKLVGCCLWHRRPQGSPVVTFHGPVFWPHVNTGTPWSSTLASPCAQRGFQPCSQGFGRSRGPFAQAGVLASYPQSPPTPVPQAPCAGSLVVGTDWGSPWHGQVAGGTLSILSHLALCTRWEFRRAPVWHGLAGATWSIKLTCPQVVGACFSDRSVTPATRVV